MEILKDKDFKELMLKYEFAKKRLVPIPAVAVIPV